ncbi:hypothetical protein LWI28_011403 [Acer negundo]|uniref:Glutamate--cysteine ligase, chloroplastic n=1 Tax=Acer negundo TaxID=4023 RepID=A0AAD5NPY9_ACENE|nr:hypothetical protein LWI28_011403 [Acer negundo]
MDPSIMKLLEEDEDESMHSGADVEAFQAALNRDIGGDVSTSQPSDSDSGKERNHDPNQSISQWQNASQDENTNFRGLESVQQQEQHSSGMDLKQHGSVVENRQQHNDGCPPLQQKQSQDNRPQGSAEQTPKQIPQTAGMLLPGKNPIQTHEPERMLNQDGESQYLKIQKMSNQPAIATEQASNAINRGKQIPFGLLLPALIAQLDKDRAMQLDTLYGKLKKNEIVKDVFVRHMRDIVGDQMLRLAVNQMQAQMSAKQFQLQSQAAARQQQLRIPSVSPGATQFTDPHSFPQLHQKGSNSSADPAQVPASSAPMHGSSFPIKENSAQKSRELERQPGSHGIHVSQIPSSSPSTANQERERPSVPVQGLNKQQQQQLHYPPTSFSMYGSSGTNYHPFSGTNVNPPGASLKPHPHDSQMRQITHHQSMGSTPPGGGGSLSHFTNNSKVQQNSVPWQASVNKDQSSGMSTMAYVKPEPVDQGTEQQNKSHLSTPQGLPAAQVEHGHTIPVTLKDEPLDKQSPRVGFLTPASIMPSNSAPPSTTTQPDPKIPMSSRMPSVTTPAGINARTPPKKPSIGQKKPLETLGSSPPPSNKKQKVSGVAFLDQSIEQLNDVTAVSGVNLREEEEQLFSGSKEDSRASEASRRVVQEEEERLILQKIPLQKKMAEIMAKCGLKSMSNDVERCLSLCVEERLRGILCNLIRLSKQRVDAEKPRHRTIITSDVRQQIMTMSRKAKEEWEKKQAEAEKLRKLNEPEGDNGVDGDKEKDDGRSKTVKVNKEVDDKMRATAANCAARAAVGGDDMLSKWQLMAEQARQKREGGGEAASGRQAGKDVNHKPSSTFGRNMKDNQEAERRDQVAPVGAGAIRKFGRNQVSFNSTPANRGVENMALVSQAGPAYRVRSEITRSTNGHYGVFGLTNNIEASRMKESSVSFSSSSYYSTKKSRILNLDGAGVGIQRGYRAIVAASPPTEDAVIATEPLTKEDLVKYLASGCKPKEKWRIGTEHEKFGFEFGTLRPMKYGQIAELLNSIAERFDWEKVMEHEYIIGLKQGQQSISLEPGGQFELSGAPLETLHQTCAEVNSHLYQVKAVAEEMGIGFLGIGFQPKWGIKDIPVMPKGRYEIMKNYMPKVGTLGLDMMFRTCTVQVNLDFSSEADMIRKFRAGLALQPIATALFANSPFTEGKPNGYLSMRSQIWTDTDNNRAGMLPFVFDDSFGFEQYVDYALDVPMYFVYRKKKYIDCSGMSFRDFLVGKLPCLPGELPTLNDWENHLTTIFPEVRLKRYLEMRGADGGPWRRLCALPAFWVGILYDEVSLQNVLDITADWTAEERQMLRNKVPKTGLKTPFRDGLLGHVAQDVLKLAKDGLERRGYKESGFLNAVAEVVRTGVTPAEKLLEMYDWKWAQSVDPVFEELLY